MVTQTKPADAARTRRARHGRTAADRGASEAFMLILLTTLIAFAGLAYDAGMAFNARREATNRAAAAARAGANDVDIDALYQGLARMAPTAEGTAENALSCPECAPAQNVSVVVDNEGQEITVSLEIVHNTKILGLIGIDSITVDAQAEARVANEAPDQ